MTKTRNISDLLDANGDVKSTALDNVPPSNDASALTTGTLPDARLSSAIVNQSAFKNIIINGDMSIAQRGTSFTGLTTGGNAYTIDRWKYMQAGATTSVFTLTQDSDVPSGQGFAKSLKMDCTTADTSVATSDIVWLMQRVEAQNLQYLKFGTSNAESLTLSFWTKSNKTGTYAVNIYQDDGAYNRALNYTISSANTWEKKTISFSGNTTNAPNNDNGAGFWVNFTLIAGTQYTSTEDTSWHSYTDSRRAFGHNVNLADSTANEWYITGVQLEAGTTASDFEFLPHDVSLQRCQRYYQFIGGVNAGFPIFQGYAPSGDNIRVPISFKVNMRSSPTVTKEGSWLVQDSAQPSFDFISNQGFSMRLQTTSSTVAYSYPNSSDDIVTMDSEL